MKVPKSKIVPKMVPNPAAKMALKKTRSAMDMQNRARVPAVKSCNCHGGGLR